MKKNVIISLADAKYFELLEELVDSVKRFKESENTKNQFYIFAGKQRGESAKIRQP